MFINKKNLLFQIFLKAFLFLNLLFYLQANSVFGKTMQNVRDYSTVKLHTSAKSALKAISNPTFKNYTILGDDLVQTNHFTPTIVHDKPIAIGFSILELVRNEDIISHFSRDYLLFIVCEWEGCIHFCVSFVNLRLLTFFFRANSSCSTFGTTK